MRASILSIALLALLLTACAALKTMGSNAATGSSIQQTSPTPTPTADVGANQSITTTNSMTGTMSGTTSSTMSGAMSMSDTTKIPMTITMPMTDTLIVTATSAMAQLQDVQGKIVGTALFTETTEGVQVTVQVSGLVTATAGAHGIHIHQVGACTPDFAAAGAHYNPTVKKHGLNNPAGPHAGDLENITFDDAGNASYSTTSNAFTISGATSLLAADGSAIVIHADADDSVTDPSGKSGGRIACGVLKATGVEPMPMMTAPPPPPGGTLNTPKPRTATPELIAGLQVPAGFTVTVFAKGLDNARMMAQAADGAIYITRRAQGDVIRLRDENGDGTAEPFSVVATGLDAVQGIVITNNLIYLGTPSTIYSGTLQADGAIEGLTPFVTGLPSEGQHANAVLGFGPDGNLYVSIGSPCNACGQGNPEYATILQVAPDGKSRRIYASGLRNALAWDWHPATGQLWAVDQGSDWRGDDQPPEELNLVEEGKNYGWPFCYANKQVDRYIPNEPMGKTKAEFCADSTAPALTYQAHSSPIDLVFYQGNQFPAAYQNSAFVTMHGSWNRTEPVGYKLVWVRFENGLPTEFADFMTGFLIEDQRAYWGRPAGLLVTQDGSLLMTDDAGGMIYQIRYTGQ